MKIVSDPEEVFRHLKYNHFHPDLNRFREAHHQQQTLTQVMETEQAFMALAIVDSQIIGYTIILSPEEEERWIKLDFLKVLGVIEVAPTFRNRSIAKKLLHSIFTQQELEHYIIISLEYCWHWDLKLTNGDPYLYRNMLRKVLESARFVEYKTNDPDIKASEVNFLMARIGKAITSEQVSQFIRLAKYNK
ncbi:acetoin utilization protein AcuA [Oikeobacillus pervagus]|uniref:Acetoin utilization protein AcuA n=1 Tax=Oikeobacillus pervagus TaxID=1325931 RepID=A0AAJ1WJF2_9BACI|nr:N-acetyltransferase [Oikeobacillus pervagus]MDQ0215403.1 acetoin utilization protein AcuA [Oikeobacillus pervagus]